jgi:DNA-binding GntR family transcriptional regulator
MPVTVETLEKLHLELISAAQTNNLERLEAKNHEFHRHINRLADSRKLLWALGMVTRYVPRRFYASISGWPQSTVEDHAKILDAIRSRDPEKIGRAVRIHLENAGELLSSHFDARMRERSEKSPVATISAD